MTKNSRIRRVRFPQKPDAVKKRWARPTAYTAADFNSDFSTDEVCLAFIMEQRWPKGVRHCLKCGNQSKHHRVGGRTAYACESCGNHIYPLAGTIFAKSRTPLKSWFYVIYLMGSTRGAITAKQLQRETGVTYKTAWRLFRRIEQLMASERLQQDGSVPPAYEIATGGDDAIEPSRCGVTVVEKMSRAGEQDRGAPNGPKARPVG